VYNGILESIINLYRELFLTPPTRGISFAEKETVKIGGTAPTGEWAI
jgi:hypothetical protein